MRLLLALCLCCGCHCVTAIYNLRHADAAAWYRQESRVLDREARGARSFDECSGLPNATENKVIVDNYLDGSFPVVMFGWTMCACVDIAQHRFAENGLCVEQRLWSAPEESLLLYLQCLVRDEQSHSFIFFRQDDGSMKFIGNGFEFHPDAISDHKLRSLIGESGANTTCGNEAIEHVNVYGSPLEDCRVGGDVRGSWLDDGTCTEAIGNVHQICLEHIPSDFSTKTGQPPWSAERAGKRHCVCIGAWSLYMSQEETNPVMPHCRAIPATALSPTYIANWKTWYVDGQKYPADVKVGIGKLVEKCLAGTEQGNLTESEKCGLKTRFESLQEREPLLGDVVADGLSQLSC